MGPSPPPLDRLKCLLKVSTVEVSEPEVVSLPPGPIQQRAPPNVVGTVPEMLVADQPDMDSTEATYPPEGSPVSSMVHGLRYPQRCAQGTTETRSLNWYLLETGPFGTLFVDFVYLDFDLGTDYKPGTNQCFQCGDVMVSLCIGHIWQLHAHACCNCLCSNSFVST